MGLTAKEADSLQEEWETLRFGVPTGLIHLWEVEGEGNLGWEEQVIAENYYAVTRSFRGDLIILAKYLFPFLR